MKKYFMIIVYTLGLVSVPLLIVIEPTISQDYYNNYLMLLIGLSLFEIFFPLVIYYEWKEEALLSILNGNMSSVSGDINIEVEKIPLMLKGKTIRKANYTIYCGVNNNIKITFSKTKN